jgi:hypothetical protein
MITQVREITSWEPAQPEPALTRESRVAYLSAKPSSNIDHIVAAISSAVY